MRSILFALPLALAATKRILTESPDWPEAEFFTRQAEIADPVSASEDAHESPRVMTVPLIVLAVCTIALSVVLTPAWSWLHGYLNGESAHFPWAGPGVCLFLTRN